eukprot:TRINITY_DN23171_c0_g1_i1.p1 TRINITY_DN23171_c0_g1~~TRINITY_DN23171_c0_g1_i1.p1  ORF type:complete len:1194 (-),score=137.97 TRINITY_DN23171_c0_g1_i1:202-3783(-)
MDMCVSGIAIPADAARGTPLPSARGPGRPVAGGARGSRPTSAKLGRDRVSQNVRDQNRKHSAQHRPRAQVPTSSARQAGHMSKGAQKGLAGAVDSGDPMPSDMMHTMRPAEAAARVTGGTQNQNLKYVPGVLEDIELDGVRRSSNDAYGRHYSGDLQQAHTGMPSPNPGDDTGVTFPRASNDLRREIGQQDGTGYNGVSCLRGVVDDLLSDIHSPLDRLVASQDQEKSTRASGSGKLEVGSKKIPSHLPREGRSDASVDGPEFRHHAQISNELHGVIQDIAHMDTVDRPGGVQSDGGNYLHGVLEELCSDFEQPSLGGALPSSTQLVLPGDAPGTGPSETPEKRRHAARAAAQSSPQLDKADERLTFDDIAKLFSASGCEITDDLLELFNQMKDKQGKVLLTELLRAPEFSRIFGKQFAGADDAAQASQPANRRNMDDLEPVAEALHEHAFSRSAAGDGKPGLEPVSEALHRHAFSPGDSAKPGIDSRNSDLHDLAYELHTGAADAAQTSPPSSAKIRATQPAADSDFCNPHERSSPTNEPLHPHASLQVFTNDDRGRQESSRKAVEQIESSVHQPGTRALRQDDPRRASSLVGSALESIPLGDQAWDRLRKVFRRVEQKHKGEGWSWEHGPAQSAKVLCDGEVPTKEVIDEIRGDLQVRHQGLLARTIMAAEKGVNISLDKALSHLEQLQDQLTTLTWERFYWLILEAPGTVVMDESMEPDYAEAQARGCSIRVGPDGMEASSANGRCAEGRAASPARPRTVLSEWPFDPDQHPEKATQRVVEELGLDGDLMRRLFDVFVYCRRSSASPVRVVRQNFIDKIKANPNLSRDLAMTSLLPAHVAKERVYWGHVLLDITCMDAGSIAWSDVLEVVRWNCAVSLGLVEQGMSGPGGLRPRASHLTTPVVNVSACKQRLDSILKNRDAHGDKHSPRSQLGKGPATAAESLPSGDKLLSSPVNSEGVNGFRNHAGPGPLLDGGMSCQPRSEKHSWEHNKPASVSAAVSSLPPEPLSKQRPPRIPPVLDDPFADRSALHTWMEEVGVESPSAAVALGFARSVQGYSKAAEPSPAKIAHSCRHPLLDYDSDEESNLRQAPAFPTGSQPALPVSSCPSGHRMPSTAWVDRKLGQDILDHDARGAMHGMDSQRGQGVQNGASSAVHLRLSSANSSLSQRELEAAVASLLDIPAASVKLKKRT